MPVLAEAGADSVPDDLLRRGRVARMGWLTLGLALVGIGFTGVFVPLLPTVDLMLLALPCFARSSPRLEAWLLNHPRFRPSLRAWRQDRAVPRHAKVAACIGMSMGYLLLLLHVQPGWMLSSAIAVFMVFWAVWIARRPEPKSAA